MRKQDVDYTLYLVTDSTSAILGDRDICDVVRQALRGGVTVVQYRDKTSDTGVLVETGKKLHAITKEYGVPLLINDRVDVALAVGCEGVHIGQDDMNITTARKILGDDVLIGVTASTPQEAIQACKDGADYLGLGTVFATETKKDTKVILGTGGLHVILTALVATDFATVPTVCIGGMSATNARQVVFSSGHPSKNLSGVAVVSAIMGSPDPEASASELLGLLKSLPPLHRDPRVQVARALDVTALIPAVLEGLGVARPLSHNMTNTVVQNFAANVTLAVEASPIMSMLGAEAADLAKLGGGLVVNMGTVTPEALENWVLAVQAYNTAGQPVVFDPVGAGATAVRRAAVKTIMSAGRIDVIKGNEGEIQTVLGSSSSQQRGVDSTPTSLNDVEKAQVVQQLAHREGCVVVMSGATDFASDGTRTFAVRHGHELLGRVTGTGCALGSVIAAVVAVYPEDKLAGAVAALVLYGGAAEVAAARAEVRGPGTFVPAFLDELNLCRTAAGEGDMSWLGGYKVEKML